jgi:hypothetical protein
MAPGPGRHRLGAPGPGSFPLIPSPCLATTVERWDEARGWWSTCPGPEKSRKVRYVDVTGIEYLTVVWRNRLTGVLDMHDVRVSATAPYDDEDPGNGQQRGPRTPPTDGGQPPPVAFTSARGLGAGSQIG